MNIAFCTNRLALIGLGVTISSLIRNCSNTNQLDIYFLCAGLNAKDKANIVKLLVREKFKGNYYFIDFEPEAHFGKLRSLHGDWAPYGRLLLADVVNESRILYLDADLVIELDVLSISGFDLKGSALAGVSGSTLKYALEHPFLNGKLGLSLDSNYFNSGVLLLDLDLWRKNNIKGKLMVIAHQYPDELLACDQTVLNALFNNNYIELPAAFNCPWYAGKPKPAGTKIIIHFVGSPKPWDVGGSIVHKGYKVWVNYLDAEWAINYCKLSLDGLRRAWRIRRSYLRVINNQIKEL